MRPLWFVAFALWGFCGGAPFSNFSGSVLDRMTGDLVLARCKIPDVATLRSRPALKSCDVPFPDANRSRIVDQVSFVPYVCVAFYDLALKWCEVYRDIGRLLAPSETIETPDSLCSGRAGVVAALDGTEYEQTKSFMTPLEEILSDRARCERLCFDMNGGPEPICAALANGWRLLSAKSTPPPTAPREIPSKIKTQPSPAAAAPPVAPAAPVAPVAPAAPDKKEPQKENVGERAPKLPVVQPYPPQIKQQPQSQMPLKPQESERPQQSQQPQQHPQQPQQPRQEAQKLSTSSTSTRQQPGVDIDVNDDPASSTRQNINKIASLAEADYPDNSDMLDEPQEGNEGIPSPNEAEKDAGQTKFISDTKEYENVHSLDAMPKSSVNNPYTMLEETDDSNFFTYFLFGIGVFILGYVIFHNKNKVLGLLVEGRRSNSTGRRRGVSSSTAYRKLDCTLEEAVSSTPPSHGPNVVY